MERKATVYTIARELGLSPSTVSRVLNNSTLISEGTRAAVLTVADRSGYRKRPIRRQSTRAIITIRLLLPPAKYSFIHLFYDVTELLSGIKAGFGDTRVNVITSINDGELSWFESKKLGDIDGCVFAFTNPDPRLEERLEERAIPFILLNRENSENNFVVVDSVGGMGKLVRALRKRRGTGLRPCYIGFSPLPNVSLRREEGTLAACGNLGVPMSKDDTFSIETIADLSGPVFTAIREGGYNAVLCFNDMLAVSVYQGAIRRGLRIPEDFSLTGFDNSPVLELLEQRIDTVEFSLKALGFEAGLWLRERSIERSDASIQKRLDSAYVPGGTI